MDPNGEQQTWYLPDGSSIRFHVRTEEPRVASIFAADLSRRLRKAQRLFTSGDADRSLAAYASYAPGDHEGSRSTLIHDLPGGEVTVVIEAEGQAIHGYLRYLVHGAVAYTEVLDIDACRAGALVVLCAGLWALLVAVGQPYLAVPFVGVSGIIGTYLGLHWLSSRGHPLSLTRTPLPTNRSR